MITSPAVTTAHTTVATNDATASFSFNSFLENSSLPQQEWKERKVHPSYSTGC